MKPCPVCNGEGCRVETGPLTTGCQGTGIDNVWAAKKLVQIVGRFNSLLAAWKRNAGESSVMQRMQNEVDAIEKGEP